MGNVLGILGNVLGNVVACWCFASMFGTLALIGYSIYLGFRG